MVGWIRNLFRKKKTTLSNVPLVQEMDRPKAEGGLDFYSRPISKPPRQRVDDFNADQLELRLVDKGFLNVEKAESKRRKAQLESFRKAVARRDIEIRLDNSGARPVMKVYVSQENFSGGSYKNPLNALGQSFGVASIDYILPGGKKIYSGPERRKSRI